MEQAAFSLRRIVFHKGKSLLFFFLMALLLEFASRCELVSPLYFPPFSKILKIFTELTLTGVLPSAVLNSLTRMGCGYALAAGVMIPLGVMIGTHRRFFLAFDPLLELLRPLPPPAIIPIAMLFLGIGDGMKVFVVFFACSFPILTSSIDGARSVPPLFIQTAKSLGFSGFPLLRKIILPAAGPLISSGLRTSLPICIIVTILAEMIGGEDGIGHWTLKMQRTFSIPEMYAGVFMTGLMGYLLNKLFLWLEGRFLGWHEGWKRAGQ